MKGKLYKIPNKKEIVQPLIEEAITYEELMLMGNEVPLEGTEEMVIKYANTNPGCGDNDK